MARKRSLSSAEPWADSAAAAAWVSVGGQAERETGRLPHLQERERHGARQAVPAEFGRKRRRGPAGGGEAGVGLGKSIRRQYRAVFDPAALPVGGRVKRGNHLGGELAGLVEHPIHQIGARRFERREARKRLEIDDLVEDEAHVVKRRGIGGHGPSPLMSGAKPNTRGGGAQTSPAGGRDV